jgi:hypothetical protein
VSVHVSSYGFYPSFLIAPRLFLFAFLLACIGRPEASASFLDQQRDFFNEMKVEAKAARRLLVPVPVPVPAAKQEAGNENQEDNSDEVKLDNQSVW